MFWVIRGTYDQREMDLEWALGGNRGEVYIVLIIIVHNIPLAIALNTTSW